MIIPRKKTKAPKVWEIHALQMLSVTIDRSMPFEATLTNAVPPGEIVTTRQLRPVASGRSRCDGGRRSIYIRARGSRASSKGSPASCRHMVNSVERSDV